MVEERVGAAAVGRCTTVIEVMIGTGFIRDCIKDAEKTAQIPAIMAAGVSQYGMQTFDQSLLALYRDEMITYEEARDAASNPDDFDLKVKGVFSASELPFEAKKGDEKASGLMGTSTPAQSTPSPSDPRRGGGGGSFFKRS